MLWKKKEDGRGKPKSFSLYKMDVSGFEMIENFAQVKRGEGDERTHEGFKRRRNK